MPGSPSQDTSRATSLTGTVDVTLVDSLLALSPDERLRLNDRMLRTIEELRHGCGAAKSHDAPGTPGGERR